MPRIGYLFDSIHPSMKYILLTLLTGALFFGCQPTEKPTEAKGTIVFDTLQERPLQIYLPYGYSKDGAYPVVYMHDGQNLFLDSTSYAGEWGADEVMDSLIAAGAMPHTIIVGVYNSPRRAEEYVPYNDETILQMMHMESWDGSLHMLFADFLVYDLMPYIESKYGGIPVKSERALIGSSLGGIQALWMGLNYPEHFSLIGAMSPSVWVDEGAIIREVHSFDSLPRLKAWIDVGGQEYDPRCSELVQNLHQRGWTYGEDLWYYEDPEGLHHESSWRKRLVNPFLLFKGLQEASHGKNKASLVELTNVFRPDPKPIYPGINVDLTLTNGVTYNAMHFANYVSDQWVLDSVGTILGPITSRSGKVSIDYPGASFELNVELSDKVILD